MVSYETILFYIPGAHNLANHSNTDLIRDFSWDQYEIWYDLKTNLKDTTDLYCQWLSGEGYPEYSVTAYLLDDYTMNGFPGDGEEFQYIMKCSNGYCYYDVAD